jgi:hypothetical protein
MANVTTKKYKVLKNSTLYKENITKYYLMVINTFSLFLIAGSIYSSRSL